MTKQIQIGFIGLGLMGSLMAKNILQKGFPLTVYNRTPSKTKELELLGAAVAKTPKELADRVDIIITMITGPKDVEEVCLGKNGISKGSKLSADGKEKALTVIDMSTIGPTAARSIAEQLAKKRIDFIDAPVTGSTPKAKSGELTIFIGAKKEVLERVRFLLEVLGTNLHYMGPIGTGQAIKLINNQIIAASILALSEGMLLADAMGLTRQKVIETLQTTPNLSPVMVMKAHNYVDEKFHVLFSVANLQKDLTLANEEIKKVGTPLPELQVTQKIYEQAAANGLADEDFSAIIKQIEQMHKQTN